MLFDDEQEIVDIPHHERQIFQPERVGQGGTQLGLAMSGSWHMIGIAW